MKAGEYYFYDLYHKLCYFELKDLLDAFIKNPPIPIKCDKSATGFIAYCYIDHECGVTFKLFSLAKKTITGVKELQRFECCNIMVRIGQCFNAEVKLLNVDKYPQFNDIIARVNSQYFTSYEVEKIRKLKEIDKIRYKENPDDVPVMLINNKYKPEIVWVRLERTLEGHKFEGTLLNEPDNDFGVHKGQEFIFEMMKNNDNIMMVYKG